eukprot:1196094-Prorocentrum_minimum.AAC.4
MGWLEIKKGPIQPADGEFTTGRCDCCAEPRVCKFSRFNQPQPRTLGGGLSDNSNKLCFCSSCLHPMRANL